MSVSITIYDNSSMNHAYSYDNSYIIPIRFGSLAGPLNGLTGDIGTAFSVWVKNTGSKKLTDMTLSATDGELNMAGGTKSTTDDAYIELALDNNSRVPNAQSVSPTIFVKTSNYLESSLISISNIVTSGNVSKSFTVFRADDDARTMLPDEYAIVWLRCVIDAARAPGGTLPTQAGLKNIKISITAKSFDI